MRKYLKSIAGAGLFLGLIAGIAYAATQTLSLGASTGPGGILTLFGSTSGSLTIQPPAAAGTGSVLTLPGGTTDFSATGGAGKVVQQATAGAALTVDYPPAAPLPTPGSSITLTSPRGYAICTTTCTITIPIPVAGAEYCIRNGNNVATVITVSNPGSSTQFERTTFTAYGTATSGTAVSGGAAGDKVCFLGLDSTHYLVMSFNGTWTMSALDIFAKQIVG
jgi:hypothetical protein